MTDKEFLAWIYDRMVNVYKEDTDADFMIRFKNIIDSFGAPCEKLYHDGWDGSSDGWQ
ncbi:MAG: hypothetical protein WC523_04805 [Patescibacteria group bacterium]